ncbi:hypothetical protein Q4503_16420 [Colwellia sp. 6_MG-2023]|uniref:hypothetical protein n=1 Tax=Colwellia sp. 6_MG-2023 TaxID=3062676 RepID=UPI0026E48A7E|nr:hypothetical protein [Colwellia sp. 6_MG-2023]MDO6489281.1 hypothetical protein [Colwellia sp. 6_MG-2023]
MKINVRVANKVIQKTNGYTFESGDYEIQPFKITRSRVGSVGAARNRYYYVAHFIGFGDMLDVHKNSIVGVEEYAHLNRKSNPKFNPNKLTWDGNTAYLV